MKTEIMKTRALNLKNIVLKFVIGLFVGYGLYHFIKTGINLF